MYVKFHPPRISRNRLGKILMNASRCMKKKKTLYTCERSDSLHSLIFHLHFTCSEQKIFFEFSLAWQIVRTNGQVVLSIKAVLVSSEASTRGKIKSASASFTSQPSSCYSAKSTLSNFYLFLFAIKMSAAYFLGTLQPLEITKFTMVQYVCYVQGNC